jgi:DNA-binding CsgD family transcriptional regulator
MTTIEVPGQAYAWSGIFPGGGRPQKPGELVGRDQDLAVIGAFVDELAAHGRVLLLSGEPGVGKSALLDAAEEIAATAGTRVLRAAGALSEDASYFGLNQLLLPLRGDLKRLDGVQRSALSAALGFSDGPACDRLVVSNAALALLRQAAAGQPLLLVIDNLQCMDPASALVLRFVARRLRGSRVGLIAAERTGAACLDVFDAPGYEVRPLSDDASARLVTSRLPGLAPAVRQRIVTEARGNPLALLELPARLSDQQRSALAPLPTVLPVSGRLAAQLRDQPERRAWHLAGSAVEPDGGMAGPLAPVPCPSQDRGDAGQGPRLATAAYLAASVLGDLAAAEALLADARRVCPGSGLSAEMALATAFMLLHGDGDVATAHRLLVRAMETARDTGAAPLTVEECRRTLVTIGRLTGSAEHPGAAPDLLDAEIESLADQAEPAEIVRIATASAFADRLTDCRPALRRVARPEPGSGSGTPAMQASILLALEAYQTGQWDEARQLAEAAAGLCASRGYQLLCCQAQTVQALVAASRGHAETAQTIADEITRWAAPRGITSLLAGAHYAGVLAAVAQSDFPAAYSHALRIAPAADDFSRDPFPAWVLLDLVEAALRTGRRGEAVAYVQAVSKAGLAAASPRMTLLSAAAMAMTAPDNEAPALFDLALASGDPSRWPFDRARVHLLAGERLRRVRAVTAARAHLGHALDEFRLLGAPTWADRAATARRATGQARQRTDGSSHQVLTPQELEIAQLAAGGLSNKEIAGRLFISHRTVASHLLRIFPKLGITSRAALGRALPRDED